MRLVRRIRSDAEVVSPEPLGRHNLPHALTPFIGREAELAQVQRRLTSDDCRLLTLLGAGGSGKTRLAIEAARRLVDQFPDGLHLVSLADVPSVEGVVPVLLEALALQTQQGREPLAQLADFLRQKRLLLLLDSFETRLDAAGSVVSLLRAAPGLKVLATSRARLDLKGEHVVHVAGLALSEDGGAQKAADADAVQLFLSAARRVRPGYRPNDVDLTAIQHICGLVQGMPLGIILASAWLEVMTPDEIAARIGSSLDFLAADWPDLPPRQRSLRATMDYSWQLLDKSLQAIFRSLSVFQVGFDAAAA
jgi:predicted ATPase